MIMLRMGLMADKFRCYKLQED
uniref:Uncharacterized protein n=1 Tax=Nelumbo nucifera TaxID=4432 RepID=A0A822ZGH8_NELNU|nr:TPA_asm: hypothetical protein HUJ06_002217 [Nelumbo nucifera]